MHHKLWFSEDKDAGSAEEVKELPYGVLFLIPCGVIPQKGDAILCQPGGA
jgi:hypothetical protein